MNAIKAVLAGVVVALASCSTVDSTDLGTGINTVDKDYKNTSVKQAHDASLATIKDENLQLDTDKWDDLGSQIVASRRTDPDNKVLVDVKAVDNNTCTVSVRVQPGDKQQAEMIQGKIAEKLGPSAK